MQYILYIISRHPEYCIAASVAVYTVLAYIALPTAETKRRVLELLQRVCIGVFIVISYFTLTIRMENIYVFVFGIIQLAVILLFANMYRVLHFNANILMFNNICMLLSIGLVIITRINFNKAVKQALIAAAGLLFVLLFPKIRGKLDSLRKWSYLYGILGIAMVGSVLALGALTNGSKLSYTIAGITFQPSEFVKILFLLFLAAIFSENVSRRKIFLASIIALAHVGILVASRDLGSALIYFVVYVAILFIATGKISYVAGIFVLGVIGAIVSYAIFSHVKVRVNIFLNPWAEIEGSGYQITQSLFAISYGGWFGAGLMRGMPGIIPFVESDFIMAAIVEEMGLIVGICLILVCLNTFINILMLSSSYFNKFYQYYTFGTAIAFIFQAFLTIGGEVKFIPLTGVTLPLVSYGGSSVLSTLMMFGIVGAIFVLQEERMVKFQQRYEQEQILRDSRNYEGAPESQRRAFPRPGSSGNDFYEKEFKGVPIYDPSKDYEGNNHFDF